MLKYQVNAGDKEKNVLFDDRPEVDDPYSKLFPKVSCAGFGYMFLWFCPIHGHCYGFHLISGGEGRNDPFASLYKFYIALKCLKTFIMILLANYLSTA